MADPRTPYVFFGLVYDVNRTTLVGGAIVKIKNGRTGDTQSFTTNELGEYTLDLATLLVSIQ